MNKSENTSRVVVSIIIPTYNSAKYLRQAIDSVFKQSFKDWELIIIDDASSDETTSLVSKYLDNASSNYDSRVRYFKNETNLGISKTRNKGISLASADSKYIAMLDSDDIWLNPNKLTEQVTAIEHNPLLGIVGTWMTQIDENGVEIGRISAGVEDEEIRHSILHYNNIAQSSVVFRKDAALAVGGYDESLATMEDHDLWLKIGTKWQFANIPTYALGYRVHKVGITKKRAYQVAADEFKVVLRHRKEYSGFIKGFFKGLLRPIYYLVRD
jgi:glycosyltransferase involved in cell wall biosynthesis